MKKAILCGLCLLVYTLASAQYFSTAQLIRKETYIDKKTVTLQSWIEYDLYLLRHGADTAGSRLPDSALFCSIYRIPYQQLRDNPSQADPYKDHPMVGLSYAQGEAYCRWRTEIYNSVPHKLWHIVYSMPSTKDLAKARKRRISCSPTEL